MCIFRDLLANDPGYLVPEVFPEVSTKRVLTTELIHGIPLDQCASLPQETRNDVRNPHPCVYLYRVTLPSLFPLLRDLTSESSSVPPLNHLCLTDIDCISGTGSGNERAL